MRTHGRLQERADFEIHILGVNCLFWSEADGPRGTRPLDDERVAFLCNHSLFAGPRSAYARLCFCSAFVSTAIDKGPARVRVYAECSYFGRRQMGRVIVCSNIRPTRASFMARAARINASVAAQRTALFAPAVRRADNPPRSAHRPQAPALLRCQRKYQLLPILQTSTNTNKYPTWENQI